MIQTIKDGGIEMNTYVFAHKNTNAEIVLSAESLGEANDQLNALIKERQEWRYSEEIEE